MRFHLAARDVRWKVDNVRGDGHRVLLGVRMAHPGPARLHHSRLEDPAHGRVAAGSGWSHSDLVFFFFDNVVDWHI